MLDRLERIGLLTTRGLSVLGLSALMVLAGLTLADGLLRWLANRPIEGVRDVGGVAIAVTIACCIPVGLMERGNITIRLAPTLLGAAAGRVLDALASIAVLGVTGALAWQFTVFAGKIARAGETTWVLKIPTAPFWYGVAAILWLAVLVQLIVVALECGRVLGRGSPGGADASGGSAPSGH